MLYVDFNFDSISSVSYTGKISRTLGFINKIGPKAMKILRLDNDSCGTKTIYKEAVLNDMNGLSCLLCVFVETLTLLIRFLGYARRYAGLCSRSILLVSSDE